MFPTKNPSSCGSARRAHLPQVSAGLATLALALLLAGCAHVTPQPLPTPTATATPAPTATPIPLAARVNGEPITLDEFQHELARFELAERQSGIDLATLGDYRKTVLQSMIDERVAAQAAQKAGLTVSSSQLSLTLQSVIEARGGTGGFEAWLAQVGYTREEFTTELQRQMLVQEMTDQVASQVPEAIEQVHARYILVADSSRAEQLLGLLRGGADFGSLAYQYSIDGSTRASGGDLGWFPRGYLTLPEVEKAAFSMDVNQISPVLETKMGYAIVQTLGHSSSQPLSPDALRALRSAAVQTWLSDQVSAARVALLITP